jgi:hypothetical protein
MSSIHRNSRRRGVSLIWGAVTLLVLVGFMGLALDTGHVLLTAHQLQNAADAAALAGARAVRDDLDEARAAAVFVAAANAAAKTPVELYLNDGNVPAGDIVLGRYDRGDGSFDPADLSPNAVKVVARRTDAAHEPLPLIFGQIFGVTTANVSRSATAMIGGGTGAGLIALCPDCQCALDIYGTPTVDVFPDDGYGGTAGIQVNSADPCSTCVQGSAEVQADELNMVGDLCLTGQPDIEGGINPGSPEIPDPLAELEEPPCDGPVHQAVHTDGTPNQPGTYPAGIVSHASGQNIVLAPGTYCLDGEGLYINGGDIHAEEVTLYVRDTTPSVGPDSAVYLGGNGIVNITPPTSGPYEFISIFQARGNENESTIIGTSSMNLEGTLYFPNAPLHIGGTGGSFGNQLIAWTLEIFGTGDFNIAYDGSDQAWGTDVFLVE